MVGQTIAERLCQTKNLAARHILQDEAALLGAQGKISEQLEASLVREEERDLESMFARPIRGRVCDFPTHPESKDPFGDETTTILKSASTQVEWLRGVALVSPSEELELSTIRG